MCVDTVFFEKSVSEEGDFFAKQAPKGLMWFVLLFGIYFAMNTPTHATDREYNPPYDIEHHPRFGAVLLDDEVRAAIQKFPNLASCLKSGAVQNGVPDLDAIDWHKIRNDGDAIVCLFMIFEQLDGPEAVKAWLERKGLQVDGPNDTARLSVGGARHFGYEYQRVPGLYAKWSLEGQNPIFPTDGFGKYRRRLFARSQKISVTWFPDGSLMEVRIHYSSIWN